MKKEKTVRTARVVLLRGAVIDGKRCKAKSEHTVSLNLARTLEASGRGEVIAEKSKD